MRKDLVQVPRLVPLLFVWSFLGFGGLWLGGACVAITGQPVFILISLGMIGLLISSIIRYIRAVRRAWAPDVASENAYAILGVKRDADLPTIRRAFRALVQRHHPDAVPEQVKEEAAATFIRLCQAYELLSDREKRFQYDGLIEDLEGGIPPFDEAYARLKDEDKHPIYADYDFLYGSGRNVTSSPDDEPSTPTVDKAPAKDEAGPVEVGIPESVLEAMGSPQLSPCSKCGRPCHKSPADSSPPLCDQCLGVP